MPTLFGGAALIDRIGRWSQEKLELLRNYLEAYGAIMRTQKWCRGYHYIDAFCGGVWHEDKRTGRLIEGSPLLALNIGNPFHTYTFIDQNENRVTNMISPLREQYPQRDIRVFHGDCNELLTNVILPRLAPRRSERGFIFLDPYGINLSWDTVLAIAEAGIFDVLINFSVMGVYRQLGDKLPPSQVSEMITQVMGTEEWRTLAYQPCRQLSLLGDSDGEMERRSHDIAKHLAGLYQKQLRKCFEHVSDFVIMLSEKNSPLYALILASHHHLAKDKMHEIFKRQEKKGVKWRRQV